MFEYFVTKRIFSLDSFVLEHNGMEQHESRSNVGMSLMPTFLERFRHISLRDLNLRFESLNGKRLRFESLNEIRLFHS